MRPWLPPRIALTITGSRKAWTYPSRCSLASSGSMLPEMSIASANARSTSLLSWALAEKAKRRLIATRRSSLAMRRLRGRVRTIRQEPYRPSEAPASRVLDSVARAPLAFVERLPEESHGLGPQPAGRSLPRRGAPLPRREPYGGLTRGRPQDRRRVRRRRRWPALAQGFGQEGLVGA